MTEHDLFCQDLMRYGLTIQLTRLIGGSVCPCTYKTGVYNPEWHRTHDGEQHCQGTGRLDTTVQELEIKAFVFNYAMLRSFIKFGEAGMICDKDIMLIGAVNAVDGSFLDLGSLDRSNDILTFQENNYFLKQSDVIATDDSVARFAILRRLEPEREAA